MKNILKIFAAAVILTGTAEAKKPIHPFDLFTPEVHEMHTGLFEMAKVPCETCHADPDSFGNREKINRLGCHTCHNNPKPPVDAGQDCGRCHIGGKFPKPSSHKAGWISKHEIFAKQNPQECAQCHRNSMFCLDCHQRRDTIQQRVHRRNFRFSHSIEARFNPRKCDACHRVNYCQQCHAGRGNSKK